MQLYQPTITGSLLVSGSVNISGSLTMIGGTLSGTASIAATASSADNFTVRNTLTAQTLVVQTITSSVSTITGSTNFGSLLANTHTFTGSMFVSGNLQLGTVSSNGVGTATPVSMSMGSTFGTNPTGSNFKLKLYDDTTPNPFGIGVSNALLEIIAGTSGAIGFFTNGSERMRITSTGNVGIGINSPSGTLELKSSTATNSLVLTTSFNAPTYNLISLNGTNIEGQYIGFAGGGGSDKALYYQSGNAGNHIFRTGDGTAFTERMRITSGGNVGIGTSNPTQLLVVSDASTHGTAVNINNLSSGGYNWNIFSVGSAATLAPVGSLAFRDSTNGITRMAITSAGKGLFGTTTPSAGASGFGSTSFQVNSEVVSMGSTAGFFWENRSGGVTNSSNWYGWYTSVGVIYLYNGAGNIANINASSGVYTATSDINKKKDFEDSTIGLDAVMNLKPTLYRMKDEEENTEKHLGFIAQEVKEFIPQAYVETGEGDDKFIGLSDRPIIAALTKAIQELKAEFDTYKATHP